tara:strand:- start:191 stop:529 length:339 start_codon:yes stop_codon:yes gene_type:complete
MASKSLQAHLQQITWRSYGSLFPYLVFLILGLQLSRGAYALQHPLTLGAAAAIVLSFFMLPRQYSHQSLENETPEDCAVIAPKLAKLERLGLILRIFYGTGAIIILGLLPRI